MNYGWRFMTLYRRQESRPSPRKKNAKSKMAVSGGLTNSCEKKRNKKQRRKGKIYPFECRWVYLHGYIYTHLNADGYIFPKNSKER